METGKTPIKIKKEGKILERRTDLEKYICDTCNMTAPKEVFGSDLKCPHCKDLGNVHLFRMINQELYIEEPTKKEDYAKKDLSPEAIEYLKSPDLMKILVKETNKFVAGEEESIQALGLASCGRLVKNSNKTSFNIIPNDESGTGKDYVTKRVLDVFVPKTHREYISRISKTALNYMHAAEQEPNWSWDGKILYLSDVSDDVLNSEVLKVFTSDATKANIVQDGKSVEHTINGKPCIFATTAASTPGKEQLRRFTLMPLDSSAAQTERIKDFIAEIDSTGNEPEHNPILVEAMEGLDRAKVIVPFSKALSKSFPSATIVRTAFGRFNDYIKASATLHQFQREKKDESIIANLDDYECAKVVFEKMYSAGNIMPITQNGRMVLNTMKKMDASIHNSEDTTLVEKHEFWTVSEIEQKAGFSNRGLRDILDALIDSKYIEKGEKEISKSRTEDNYGHKDYMGKVMAYRVINQIKFNLPSKEELVAAGVV